GAAGPFAGLRGLDLTEYMAGADWTGILGGMGGGGVKLERARKGGFLPRARGKSPQPPVPLIHPKKKKPTPHDKAPEGREVFLKLVRTIDILVENYRPTVLPKVKLGYDDLIRENPRLIYAQLSGFGYDGPYQEKGGFDLIAQATGGVMYVTGET